MSADVPPRRPLKPATQLVHGGTQRSSFGELSEALYLTQSFAYPTMEAAEARFKGDEPGFIYSRFSNPTVAMFEQRMILLEGAEAARATASGMAAVTASLLAQLKAGDHVVSARALFGSCLYVVEDLLRGWESLRRSSTAPTSSNGRRLSGPETKLFFLESPTNPGLEVYDLQAIADIAHEAGAKLVVDNVFATPLLQKPFDFGADVVVYSATKHIDGQGRCLGGVILASQALIEESVHNFLRQTGPAMSPFNAWVMLKGLETLPLRVAQQTASAAKIADFLAGEKAVRRVLYPFRADHPQVDLARRQMSGGGTLASFDMAGGKAAAFRLANALEIIKISNNLGDAKSLVTHPATTTHQRLTPEARAALGIGDGLLRLSVGLEDADDLIDDLARGIWAAARA
ncbi:MAG: O-succinylhomoserine sulfhydrylase [Methylocystis sp.]